MKPSQKTVKCIDWSQVIFDLHAVGMSWREIAIECGYGDLRNGDDGGKRWVQRLKNLPPTQPDFHSGALLIGLWAERMRRPVSEIPREQFRYVRNAMGRIEALPLVDVAAEQFPRAVAALPQES